MALNIQTFKTRSLTAIIFVIVMLGGLLINQWGFIALFTIIHFGCWYEFVKLMKKINTDKYIGNSFLGLTYITIPVLMMLFLGLYKPSYSYDKGYESFQYSYLIPCAIIFSIWINDTMAYIVGSFIGKTPFSKISPKKTWEGTLGGIILCVVVITLLGYALPLAQSIKPIHWIVISLLCAIGGTAGDLLESKIKRMADVKDSGSIMPGHGGFLDRFDSLLIATPLVWLYVNLFMF
ncbi:phosphatidate cytidylyltransferase [Ferruginibacter albus]|uniref:phosphatidate cytidylyltransferase n=1 Tax=Ferruginibacter albus TaxID=2875540 RepID=UPI001CC5403B|nr:phosphatidate cytidylyltransferase [Ferruginibacter albus]UAY51848.1 phosphatidate cytidylyltransferase [Ferruginibacter albus]